MAPSAVPRRSWAARFARRQRVRGSLWIVPLAAALAGPLIAEGVLRFDDSVDMPSAWSYSESTASVILGAIVSALVALTGFVVAFGVLVVQMATQTLSPRFMRLWYRDGLQKAVLGTFVGTLTFSLALLRGVSDTSVPDAGVTLAGVAVTVCVVLFLVYLDRFVHTPAAGRRGLEGGRGGRARLPRGAAGDDAARRRRHSTARRCSPSAAPRRGRSRRSTGTGCWRRRSAHDCVLVLPHAVGDIVPHDSVLLEVHGTTAPPADVLRGMLALGEERTIEQDPAFALRILVDIAIRALSPAVNDPNTACQVMGGDRGPAAGDRRERPARPRRAARRRRARCGCWSGRAPGRTCSRSR